MTYPELIIEELDQLVEPKTSQLGFGKYFTNRMLLREFKHGTWNTGKITAYQDLHLPPATVVFHYGQAIFEGMKAYRHPDGSVKLFRPYLNAKRFNHSAERLVMPTIDESYFVETIKKLVSLEADWVPSDEGSSLYIRPTMIASEPFLGVKPSSEYLFFVILSPSGSYFRNGFQPTKIKVETTYIRAAEGGTGNAKAAANYAGSMLGSKIAKDEGYDQVLWLDSKERKYVEEVGSMNIAFVINNEIYSPKPKGTILDGITRRSVKTLAEDLNFEFNEDPLTIDSVIQSIESGDLTEVFGIGTAAVISPVGLLNYMDRDYIINDNKIGEISQQLYDELTGIQYGRISDRHQWMIDVE